MSESRYFYKKDELKIFDCSKRGFPKKVPLWVAEAIANNRVCLGPVNGMAKERWFLKDPEKDYVTVLDDTFTLLVRDSFGNLSAIPKAVAKQSIVEVRDKIVHKKKEVE